MVNKHTEYTNHRSTCYQDSNMKGMDQEVRNIGIKDLSSGLVMSPINCVNNITRNFYQSNYYGEYHPQQQHQFTDDWYDCLYIRLGHPQQ